MVMFGVATKKVIRNEIRGCLNDFVVHNAEIVLKLNI